MSDEKLRGRRKAAIADKDNPVWTEADFARAKPASEVLGRDAAAALVRPRGGSDECKRQVTMRLSTDVMKAARKTALLALSKQRIPRRHRLESEAAACDP